MPPKVAVIGAGVNGVGSALAILQTLPQASVTIVTDQLTPNTTGDGAAGIWGPNLVAGDPQKIKAWSGATHDLFHRLWLEGDCPGIGLVSGFGRPRNAPHVTISFHHDDAAAVLQAETPDKPAEPLVTDGLSQVAPRSRRAQEPHTHTQGLSQQVTFYAEPSKFLPFLLSRFRTLGGDIIVSAVTSVDQLAEYDIIVNCTGLGARELFGDDTLCPIRGQLVRVRAPFVKTFLGNGDFYIVPNDDVIILGGTKQRDDWRREPDPADTTRIVDGCCRLVPALRTAPVASVWAGLRPFRPGGVRLELERHLVAGRWRSVVHNYGHGGAGVTMFWGCALEVAALVREQVQGQGAKSKL